MHPWLAVVAITIIPIRKRTMNARWARRLGKRILKIYSGAVLRGGANRQAPDRVRGISPLALGRTAPGSAGLALPWQIEGFGTVLVETVRLMEREAPYILQVELARGRLLRIAQKAEDGGLIGHEGTEESSADVERGRGRRTAALDAGTIRRQ